MMIRRTTLHICALMLIGLMGLATQAAAEPDADTAIYIDLPDMAVYPGDSILIPVGFSSFTDSVEAFSLTFVTNRPGLIHFVDSLIVDTTVACNDPPICADTDTLFDTLFHSPPYRTGNTLAEDWDAVVGFVISSQHMRINAASDLDLDHLPVGIPPLTLGERLVNALAWADCDPDTISGFTVGVDPIGQPDFSTPLGQLILPVSFSGATITILSTATGDLDHSREFNVIDVVLMVNCAFKNDCPGCTRDLADINCDGTMNVIDVVLMVNHVFRGGPVPGC